MENLPDLIHLIVKAMALSAVSLDHWLHVPWPLVIGILLFPITAALDVMVWSLRGQVFPLPCGYQTLEQRPCRIPAVGEWHRCFRHRNKKIRVTDGHEIDPTLRRWQIKTSTGKVVEAKEPVGLGFLSMRKARTTFFYFRGFARPPEDVFRPKVLCDYLNKAKDQCNKLRLLGWRGLFISSFRDTKFAGSYNLPSVIQATRLVLTLVLVSLGLVILAIALPPLVGASFEYLASFGFITALAIIRAGIWKATPQWPWEAARESLKWILGLTGIATLSGILGVYSHEIVDFIKAIVTTIFTGISLLFVLSLLYGVNKHQLRYRSVRIRRAGNYRRRRFR